LTYHILQDAIKKGERHQKEERHQKDERHQKEERHPSLAGRSYSSLDNFAVHTVYLVADDTYGGGRQKGKGEAMRGRRESNR